METMLTRPTMVIIWQYIQIKNRYVVHLKLIKVCQLYLNTYIYTDIHKRKNYYVYKLWRNVAQSLMLASSTYIHQYNKNYYQLLVHDE